MPTFTVKPVTKKKERADEILNEAVARYKELQAKLTYHQDMIRKEMEAPRLIIESAAKNAPDGKIVTETYKINYIEISSERLDKDAVIKAFGRKKVEPYLSTTTYHQLRVS